MRARWKRPSLIVGGILCSLLVIAAIVAPYAPLPDPAQINLMHQYEGPSPGHVLGLGENGIDLASHLLWGSRLSLKVGLGSVTFAALIGLILGSFAGYRRGYFDLLLMRAVDVLYAFPGILLIVALAAVLGPSVRNMMIVLIATSWASYARLVRGVAMGLRERDFVKAAQAVGASTPRIIVCHLWPNILAPLVVQMTFGLGSAIMAESSLGFLGLGAPPGTPSWGQLLNQGRQVLLTAPHVILAPGLALVLAILGLNLLGDGLRDWLDPKTK